MSLHRQIIHLHEEMVAWWPKVEKAVQRAPLSPTYRGSLIYLWDLHWKLKSELRNEHSMWECTVHNALICGTVLFSENLNYPGDARKPCLNAHWITSRLHIHPSYILKWKKKKSVNLHSNEPNLIVDSLPNRQCSSPF